MEELIDPKESELNIVSTLSSNPFQTGSQRNTIEIEENISFAFYEEPNIKPQPNGIHGLLTIITRFIYYQELL